MNEQVEGAPAPAGSSEGSETATPRPRRRRRGGRGRSRSAAAKTEVDRGAGAEEGKRAPEPGPDRDTPEKPAPGEEPKATTAKRRRRRGGRGRGKRPAPGGEEAAGKGSEKEPAAPEETAGEDKPKPTRRRRRPAAAKAAGLAKAEPAAEGEPRAEAGSEPGAAEGPTKAKRATRRRKRAAPPAEPEEKPAKRTRKPAAKKEVAAKPRKKEEALTGPTRLRRPRITRRRREPTPVIRRTEDKVMVLTENGERDQIAVLEDRELVQHFVTRPGARSMVGNVYLGRVQNVLPGMEAAFVDIGRGRNAVLYAGEVNYSEEDLEGSPPRIEQVLKSGQSIIVEVTKDPMGGKGSRLTAQISLPGRYLVLVPNSQVSGISRRLPDDERSRLKAIVNKVKPEGHGLIVRTAADGATEEAIAADIERLLKTWEDIEKRAKKVKAPHVLYEEPELTVRVVRDLFTDGEFKEIVTDSPRIHEEIVTYLRDVAPDLLEKVRRREGKLPAFEEFHIIEQIHKGLDRKVWLPSGGYLVIERTEALTVIDVNTGKHVGKTNLEAAKEVARQLRLRDIGGMIIIDFIDMLLDKNKKKVVETLREELAQDKTRSQVFDISPLGLLEVTRKRVSAGLLESFSETCPACEGRGILLTHDI